MVPYQHPVVSPPQAAGSLLNQTAFIDMLGATTYARKSLARFVSGCCF